MVCRRSRGQKQVYLGQEFIGSNVFFGCVSLSYSAESSAMDQNAGRLPSYAASSAVLIMRRSLKSSGWWSIFWGGFWLFILSMEVVGNGAASIGLLTYLWLGLGGLLLVGEGIFVMRTFSPKALMAEAATLAALGAMNLLRFAMLVSGKGGGRANPLYGLVMLYNAFTTWKARTALDELMAKTNEQDLAYVTEQIERTMSGEPKNSPDLIEFKASGLVKEHPDWRMKVVDGVAFLVNYAAVFGRGKRPIQIITAPVRSIQFDITGETWIGSKSKCRLTLDGKPTDMKFEIERTMLEKVQMSGAVSSLSASG
jgi:hypothetical protein